MISEGETTPASPGSNSSVEWHGTAWYSKEETFFLKRVAKHWNKLPRAFERCVDVALMDIVL